MTRRLLGYVVKLPDGTRSPRTPKPVPVIGDAVDAWIGSPSGSYICPVFGRPKPVVVPPLAQAMAILSIDEPKPAPAEGAAEGRYAALVTFDSGERYLRTNARGDYVGNRDESIAAAGDVSASAERRTIEVVRILPDGAHEAACEAARREGTEAAFAAVLTAGGNMGATKDLVLRARSYVKAGGK